MACWATDAKKSMYPSIKRQLGLFAWSLHKQSLGLHKSSEASRTFSADGWDNQDVARKMVKPADSIPFGCSVHGSCVLMFYFITLIVCMHLVCALQQPKTCQKLQQRFVDSTVTVHIAEADSWLQLWSETGEEVWMPEPVIFFWCNRLEIRKFIIQRS